MYLFILYTLNKERLAKQVFFFFFQKERIVREHFTNVGDTNIFQLDLDILLVYIPDTKFIYT